MNPADATTAEPPKEAAVAAPPYPTPPSAELNRLAMVLMLGWLVTNLALSVMDLPLRFLLKDTLGKSPSQVSKFFAIGNFTNYIKPVAGVLTDGIPLMGTRRLHYLLLGIGGGGFLFLLLGVVPQRYAWLLATYSIFYVTVVLTSTTLGGRMVEVGNEHNAAGRLTAQRIGMFKLAALAGAPIGGWLAQQALPFPVVMAMSASLHFALIPIILWGLSEPRTATRNLKVFEAAAAQSRILLKSRILLAAAGMIFLIAVAPGFGTPLLFYQTDILHFPKAFVGVLGSVSAGAGFVGCGFYYAYCRRWRLRSLLAFSIVAHTLGTLIYLDYHSTISALVITAISGITGALAMLPVYDIAARGTPIGSEALGYSVMMSVWNLTNAISDWTGSRLFETFSRDFPKMVWINAVTTAVVLLAVPLLPRALLSAKDGDG